MILRDYINFEKNIDNRILSVMSYEFLPDDEFVNPKCDENSLFIFINIGDILQIEVDGKILLCPPKFAYIGNNKPILVNENIKKHLKFSLFLIKSYPRDYFIKRIVDAVDAEYKHIFIGNSFLLGFNLNIDILDLIEGIYKLDDKVSPDFHLFEIEAKLHNLLARIIRMIVYEESKFMENIFTNDSKYLMVLKDIFKNNCNLQDSLDKFKLDESDFYARFNSRVADKSFQTFQKEIKGAL